MSDQKPLYTVQQVANFFLDKGREDNIPITQMKLIKIVYFAYGWVLAITGKRLFSDTIEAWQHGPVIPALYHEFKSWGSHPIDIDYHSYECDDGTGEVFFNTIPNNEDSKILNTVWDTYKGLAPRQLRDKSCEKGSPWEKVYVENQYNIQNERIKDYFLKELNLSEYLN
ncbi:Panacea domain-containing protein [Bartonella sp. CB60]|uniref:Panacea domain-containing protein n=1 Tax=Bartonella sp. CB60 TaxID=3113619 RepID=UPI00300E6A0A